MSKKEKKKNAGAEPVSQDLMHESIIFQVRSQIIRLSSKGLHREAQKLVERVNRMLV